MIAGLLLLWPLSGAHAGRLNPEQVRETQRRIREEAGLLLPFISQVLEEIPIESASFDKLASFGSSRGAYFRGVLYLDEKCFDPKGLKAYPDVLSVFAHEAWHAYYDRLMPPAEKAALERHWIERYGTSSRISNDVAICIGDESVGNYLGDLTSGYGFMLLRTRAGKKFTYRQRDYYEDIYSGRKSVRYCEGLQVEGPVSSREFEIAHRVSGKAFPKPDALEAVLARRLSNSQK